MGIFLFWFQYILSGIILYNILRCIYIKGDIVKTSYSHSKQYYKTDKDERLKHPLWIILVFIISFLIPVVNIVFLTGYLIAKTSSPDGEEYSEYYLKSFLTKKY